MARCYPGTVLIEGTQLSEGRGTTRALELIGAPGLDATGAGARDGGARTGRGSRGCRLRTCFFEPTFQKHARTLCGGVQIHVDHPGYDHARVPALSPGGAAAEGATAGSRPDAEIWRDFAYEYEHDRLAIDLINGGPRLREWVDDPAAGPGDLERELAADEASWRAERRAALLYGE